MNETKTQQIKTYRMQFLEVKLELQMPILKKKKDIK